MYIINRSFIYSCIHSDVNECEDGSDSCGPLEECYNTPGSYYCSCQQGYRRQTDDICTGRLQMYFIGIVIVRIVVGVIVFLFLFFFFCEYTFVFLQPW